MVINFCCHVFVPRPVIRCGMLLLAKIERLHCRFVLMFVNLHAHPLLNFLMLGACFFGAHVHVFARSSTLGVNTGHYGRTPQCASASGVAARQSKVVQVHRHQKERCFSPSAAVLKHRHWRLQPAPALYSSTVADDVKHLHHFAYMRGRAY